MEMHMNSAQLSKSFVVPLPVPALLGFVAGYVDSCTYLALFGAFVAQLTGSFVAGGMHFVGSEWAGLSKHLAIPCFFLAGAATTALVHALRGQPRVALACSLGAEFCLLIGFLGAYLAWAPFHGPEEPRAVLTLLFGIAAMGAQSTLVRLLMRGVASTNVMTTNTTILAISATETLLGWIHSRKAGANLAPDPGYMQARRELIGILPIVSGFFLGTVCGALAYAGLGILCLLVAILPVGGLAIHVLRQT
jgi:uncharacterized membrane protein YoaK (UPF0700 family)